MNPGVPPLSPGTAHVWIGSLGVADRRSLHRLLSPDEKARAESYRFQTDRDRYVLQHVMLRSLLGTYLGTEPSAIEFVSGEYGKPQQADALTGAVEFNCSRSRDLAVCSFCCDRPVGVDVEFVRTDFDFRSLAATAFNPEEVRNLAAIPEDRVRESFFELWTRKEAAAKMTGQGLNVDIRTVDGSGVSLSKLEVPDGYVGHLASAVPFPRILTLRWPPHR